VAAVLTVINFLSPMPLNDIEQVTYARLLGIIF